MELTQSTGHLSTQELGRLGESLAADYLVALGYTIIARNWRCQRGELDLVVRLADTIVAVEVKTRRGTLYGAPLEAIGYVKARRLRSLLSLWVREHRPRSARLRIDAIGITLQEGVRPRIDHVEGLL